MKVMSFNLRSDFILDFKNRWDKRKHIVYEIIDKYDCDIIGVQEVTNKMLEKTVIKEVLNKFLGKQEQIPPIYSAIKVNGKKLYEYARKGQTVEIKPRQIEIYSIELLSIDKKLKQIEFEVSCSKGTYIRSLCEDIGNKLRNCSIYERIAKNQGWGFFYNKCNKY